MTGKTYRIGEAAKLLNLKTYVLRFWETEFPQLAPLRTESGQRLYSEEHIALLREIQNLLHEKGMTIDGAKKHLADQADESQQGLLAEVVAELEAIRAVLRGGSCA